MSSDEADSKREETIWRYQVCKCVMVSNDKKVRILHTAMNNINALKLKMQLREATYNEMRNRLG